MYPKVLDVRSVSINYLEDLKKWLFFLESQIFTCFHHNNFKQYFLQFQRSQKFWHFLLWNPAAPTIPSIAAWSSRSTCVPSKSIKINVATHATQQKQKPNNVQKLNSK